MATRNTMEDLNNHLFEALETLKDNELSKEDLEAELERSKVVSMLAKDIISNASLALDVMKFKDNRLDIDRSIPTMLESNDEQ